VDLQASVAVSLDAEQKLVPHMPFLIQDLWAMGCALEQILQAAGSLGLPAGGARVLDLGCGKGAVSVRLAENCGFQVLGIDAMAPFLEEARDRAAQRGVARLCRFEERDIREFASAAHDFDLVVLASLGGVLGALDRTVAALRTQVRGGGFMIIDDGFLKGPDRIERRGYEHYLDRAGTLRALTAHGDRLVLERDTSEASREINREFMAAISRRAKELARLHPELDGDLDAFVRSQREDCRILEEKLHGALWVLEKSGTGRPPVPG